MKKLSLLLASIALVGAGCTGGSASPQSANSLTTQRTPSSDLRDVDKPVAERVGDSSQVDSAESKLGIDLPDDTGILSIVDGQNGLAVSGRTDLSITELRSFLNTEFTKAGLTTSRSWGVVGSSSTSDTATYRKGNETWGVFIRVEGIRQTFEIQIQK